MYKQAHPVLSRKLKAVVSEVCFFHSGVQHLAYRFGAISRKSLTKMLG
jgi:hypothetical protein